MSGYTKVLGIGAFFTECTGDVITVHAVGVASNSNYVIKLEQALISIWPPEIVLYYYIPQVVLPALRPFHVEACFPAKDRVDSATVTDATGRHDVEVRHDHAFAPPAMDEFIVIARVGTTPPSSCHVIPADHMYIQTHYKTYGPASKADCETWVLGNCTPAA